MYAGMLVRYIYCVRHVAHKSTAAPSQSCHSEGVCKLPLWRKLAAVTLTECVDYMRRAGSLFEIQSIDDAYTQRYFTTRVLVMNALCFCCWREHYNELSWWSSE